MKVPAEPPNRSKSRKPTVFTGFAGFFHLTGVGCSPRAAGKAFRAQMQLFVFAQNKKWPEFQRFNEVNDDILERREVAMSRKRNPCGLNGVRWQLFFVWLSLGQ